ncbi:MAG: hypothetical protein JJ979_01240 [Roseibium sp.]|nr:hypothetical protein [Roseibium sp.]
MTRTTFRLFCLIALVLAAIIQVWSTASAGETKTAEVIDLIRDPAATRN